MRSKEDLSCGPGKKKDVPAVSQNYEIKNMTVSRGGSAYSVRTWVWIPYRTNLQLSTLAIPSAHFRHKNTLNALEGRGEEEC